MATDPDVPGGAEAPGKKLFPAVARGLRRRPAYLLIFGVCALFVISGVGTSVAGVVRGDVTTMALGAGSFAVALAASLVAVRAVEGGRRRVTPGPHAGGDTSIGTGHHIVAGEGAFQALVMDLSIGKAPTARELEGKDDCQKVRYLVSLCDRKAVFDKMYEEDVALMCRSLNNLRLALQVGGVSTIASPAARSALNHVKGQVEQCLVYALYLDDCAAKAGHQSGFLDLRALGLATHGLQELQQLYRERLPAVDAQFQALLSFCKRRLVFQFQYARNLPRAKRPTPAEVEQEAAQRGVAPEAAADLMTERRQRTEAIDWGLVARDVAIMYLFGAMDELKRQVQAQLAGVMRALEGGHPPTWPPG